MARAHRDVRIVLVGKTGSGKSSTGNTILGRNAFTRGSGFTSVTKHCERHETTAEDRNISVIDTPGLYDTAMSGEELKAEIEKCVIMSVPGPHAFLLIIRLDVRFTDEERNTVKWIQENFGEEAAHYTIILFTHADALKKKPLDECIRESNDLQALVNKCGGRFHSFNNNDMENRDQVTELMEKIEMMVEENGGKHYTSEIYKQAQRQIRWEARKQKMIQFGETALVVGGGVAAVAAVGAAAIAAGAGGPGAAAIARAAAGAAVRGAVGIAGRAAATGGVAAAGRTFGV